MRNCILVILTFIIFTILWLGLFWSLERKDKKYYVAVHYTHCWPKMLVHNTGMEWEEKCQERVYFKEIQNEN